MRSRAPMTLEEAEKNELKLHRKSEKKAKRQQKARVRRKRFAIVISVLLFMLSLQTGSVSKKEDVPVVMQGQFRCDWFDETIIYPYTYSDAYFDRSPYEYNHELALYSLCVSMASFRSFDNTKPDEHICKMLNECGYDIKTYAYASEGYDEIALAVGRKDIELKGEKTTLLIAAIRSGNYGMEWGGNVRVGTGVNHEGFEISKDKTMLYFNEYFEDFEPYGTVKLLIPAYSRGSSIGNLFAAELIDGSYVETLGKEKDNIAKAQLKAENIYSYLYEIPQCTSDPNASDALYSNIINIVNPNDYVPMFVMDNFDFTCYGKKYYLPSASRCADYEDYYTAACDEFNSFMAHTGKKPNKFFYSQEDSLSCEAIFNQLFYSLAKDVMIDREYYVEHLERPMIFFGGQYLGKKRGIGDFLETVSVMATATVQGVKPSKFEQIKTEGYVPYLADSVEASEAGADLTDEEIEGFFEIINKLLNYIEINFGSVKSLISQINMVINVHQPYVQMTWMRLLTEEQMLQVNSDIEDPLRLNCHYLFLDKGSKGKIDFEHLVQGGRVEWSSEDEAIATVDEDGVVVANAKGETKLKAVLYDKQGNEISLSYVEVNIK